MHPVPEAVYMSFSFRLSPCHLEESFCSILSLCSLNPFSFIHIVLRKCRYVSERVYTASLIHRNPESLQVIGCCVLPLVGMDLLDKRTIF